jgi:hypothetical protein
MRKFLLLLTAVLGAAALAVPVALASVAAGTYSPTINAAAAPQGTHYKSGSATASCTVSSTGSVSCNSYTLGGVGNINATETLTAVYTATVACINAGGNPSDSQHQGSFSTTTGPIPLTSDKNGFLTVLATAVSPPSASDFLAQQTCPNPNWTPVLASGITLFSFTYTLHFAGFSGNYITISATDP